MIYRALEEELCYPLKFKRGQRQGLQTPAIVLAHCGKRKPRSTSPKASETF